MYFTIPYKIISSLLKKLKIITTEKNFKLNLVNISSALFSYLFGASAKFGPVGKLFISRKNSILYTTT